MGKVIDLNEWRSQKKGGDPLQPILGTLVWLHCPTCQITEYTELRMHGGRIHKCGTLVEEVEVSIDIRAEYTISQRNLEILEKFPKPHSGGKLKKLSQWMGTDKILQTIQHNEEEYQHRLRLMTPQKITPYPDEWSPEKNGMDCAKMQPSGILITPARQPNRHFPEKD